MYNGCGYPRHAETDALKKLPPNHKKKKIVIDIIVIRINKICQLTNSKPCFKCIEHMNNIKGYKIRNIYYSNANYNISVTNFTNIFYDEDKQVSRYYRSKIWKTRK